jgi:hypothetical protein
LFFAADQRQFLSGFASRDGLVRLPTLPHLGTHIPSGAECQQSPVGKPSARELRFLLVHRVNLEGDAERRNAVNPGHAGSIFILLPFQLLTMNYSLLAYTVACNLQAGIHDRVHPSFSKLLSIPIERELLRSYFYGSRYFFCLCTALLPKLACQQRRGY